MANVIATAAANRFGLGARADELTRIGSDPRGWLRSQLAPGVIDAFAGLPDSAEYLADYYALRKMRRELKRNAGAGTGNADANTKKMPVPEQRVFRRKLARESILRQQVALRSQQSFAERIVRFWSNHFAISVDKNIAAPFAAPMEREAIRPHAFGKFADLLLAVERHPGMLLYLDNAQSVGSDSRLAERTGRRRQANPQQRKRGLNENLARETLELHTLGVNGGYSQADVIELARAITGWSVASPRDNNGNEAFVFRVNAHEPGARHVLGKAYADDGEAQGRFILHDLALHPATARHLAFKLARHFVADVPPPALVERMANAYVTSGGELTALYRTLIDDDASWSADARKFKTPDDFVLSALRGCGLDRDGDVVLSLDLLARMGQPLFQPRSPAGFADTAADWSGPDALFKRVQAAQAVAERVPAEGAVPLQLGEATLGPALDSETATALRRAESVQQGVALLLASPVFQWRV